MGLSSCSNPEQDFHTPEQANTEQAYHQFIEKHPDGPLIQAANMKIEQLLYAAERVQCGHPSRRRHFEGFTSNKSTP